MNDNMVFTASKNGFIRAGGFLVKQPLRAPISILPDGLAVPAGLFTMHHAHGSEKIEVEPSKEVVEPSICDFLLEQVNGAKRLARKTKRRAPKTKRSKKNTRSIKN